jgi:hypothetical protein
MFPNSYSEQDVPLKIVGSNKFGRYPKISDEQTINMIISDGWLTAFAGFKNRAFISGTFTGRGSYNSERWGNALVVIGSSVYGVPIPAINSTVLNPFFIGEIETADGDVFFAENMNGEIAFVDGRQIYVFNWQNPSTPAIVTATLPVDGRTGQEIVPGYITYLNSQLVVTNEESGSWFLSGFNDALNWNPFNSGPWFTFIQTKPTNVIAAVRWPGRGNLLAVFGKTVVEMWTYVGAALFPYQKNQSVNIDYGCINAATIAANENYVMWLGINEQSGPVIMLSQGSDAIPVSSMEADGIDFRLASLVNPAKSHAFFFKQDGHLFYQITFSDPQDNLTLIYDFKTKKFFTLTDENLNYHPAESVFFFNNTWYFVSLNDGSIYETSTNLTTYDYTIPGSSDIRNYEIQRIRITSTFRLPDTSRFRINSLSFPVEQGADPYYPGNYMSLLSTEDGAILTTESGTPLMTQVLVEPYQPSIDMSASKDGGNVFGSYISKKMFPQGKRKNRVTFYQLGIQNEITYKYKFLSKGRFVVGDGVMTVVR